LIKLHDANSLPGEPDVLRMAITTSSGVFFELLDVAMDKGRTLAGFAG
jgi:hypothetical protein